MGESAVKTFESWQQLAYGAAKVARMAPNFRLFCDVVKSDDGAVFNSILNLVWEYVSSKNESIDFSKQLLKLEDITPEPENYDMYGVWPALDATVALSSLLSCCERFDEDEMTSIANISKATIHSFVEALIDNEKDAEARVEELIEIEDDFDQAICVIIQRSSKSSRPTMVQALKQQIAEFGTSNLGLEL